MNKNQSYHEPVLLKVTVDLLNVERGKKYIDATLGGGGHGVEIVRWGGNLLGIDADREAIEFANKEFRTSLFAKATGDKQNSMTKKEGEWKIVRGNFRELERIAYEEGFNEVSGILFDLGISSHQLDTSERGFSFRREGPFDLRLDQSTGESAAYYINRLSEEELYEIMATLGEEEYARAICVAIIRARAVKSLLTTRDVYEVVAGAMKWDAEGAAARVFQAFRMYVNDELRALRAGLSASEKLLTNGGRLAVISFHSLEDRIVKQFFQRPSFRKITKKPVVASEDERERNSRCRSAKLRVGEKQTPPRA